MTDTLTATRRETRTYVMDGRERYADTGRTVDERLGSHVVLWIVDDADAWATAIEAGGDQQPGLWPRRQRHIGEHRREQAYASAARVRAEGAHRRVHATCHRETHAAAMVADLWRSHPNPGVHYEVAAIERADACPTEHCRQPRILAGGTWWHHAGRYPTECAPPAALPDPDPQTGDFVIDRGHGTMRCGWCEQLVHWVETAKGYVRLTGFHVLGLEKATGRLVVLAEGTASSGHTVHLPHHCAAIPEDVHARFAPDSVLFRAE